VTLGQVREQLGWRSLRIQLELTVQRGSGEAKAKQMEVLLRDDPEGQKLLATFTQPSHMAGTAFLALLESSREDRYFLYLRSLRRAKRVPTGTENFMLRDFLSLYLLKPRPKLWSEKVAPAAGDTQALTLAALDERTRELTGYARQVHTLDPARKVIVDTTFYDEADRAIRKQKVTEFRTVEGHVLPWVFETEDSAEGVRATIRILKVDWNPELPVEHFTLRHLKRR